MKSFQITSEHNKKTSKGSVTPILTNAAAIDLIDETSNEISIVMYGGQFADIIVTSGEVVTFKGVLTITDDLADSKIDVTTYPDKAKEFKEFKVPEGWKNGSELVQQREVPTSRAGHCFTILRSDHGEQLVLYPVDIANQE